MKCDKCGMHEANCHYTMRINGRTTERHLCSQCAGEMGIEQDVFGDFRNLFDDMFGGFFGGRALDPWSELTAGMPRMTMPRMEILLDGCGGERAAAERAEEKYGEGDTAAGGTDPEMSRKRELNVLRRQMKRAAAEEDFETAAKIRDQIRELEKQS